MSEEITMSVIPTNLDEFDNLNDRRMEESTELKKDDGAPSAAVSLATVGKTGSSSGGMLGMGMIGRQGSVVRQGSVNNLLSRASSFRSTGTSECDTEDERERKMKHKLHIYNMAKLKDWRQRRPSETDWFGNVALHHAFSNREAPDVKSIKEVVAKYPEMCSIKNQFGRIPLHYAMDGLKVDMEAVESLIRSYPKGVSEEDNNGISPYDLARKWHPQNKALLRRLLKADPSHDRESYIKFTYGPLGSLYCFLFHVPGRRKMKVVYEKVDDEEDNADIDEYVDQDNELIEGEEQHEGDEHEEEGHTHTHGHGDAQMHMYMEQRDKRNNSKDSRDSRGMLLLRKKM